MHLTDYHGGLELELYRLLNRGGGPALDLAMRALSARLFGIAIGLLLLGALFLRLGRSAGRAALALAFALLASDLLGARVLKPLLGRMRPCYALEPGTFRWLSPAANVGSLPSLHAANAFALAFVVAMARARLAPLAYLFAVLVALSRVYVGVHWPTDVLAGAAWGTISGALGWALSGVLLARRRPEPRGGRLPPGWR